MKVVKRIPFEKNGDLANYVYYRNKSDFTWIDDPGPWNDELEYVEYIMGNSPSFIFKSANSGIKYNMSFTHFMHLLENDILEINIYGIRLEGTFKFVQHGCSYGIEWLAHIKHLKSTGEKPFINSKEFKEFMKKKKNV
jgi:hypothetical protein